MNLSEAKTRCSQEPTRGHYLAHQAVWLSQGTNKERYRVKTQSQGRTFAMQFLRGPPYFADFVVGSEFLPCDVGQNCIFLH